LLLITVGKGVRLVFVTTVRFKRKGEMLVFFDGCGEWFLLGNGPYAGMGVDDECISAVRITGVFKLPQTNKLQIEQNGSSLVKNLLPCYTDSDGMTCEGYTEKDEIYFKMHEGIGFDESLGRAAYLGKVFTTKNIIEESIWNSSEEKSTTPTSKDEGSSTIIDDSVQVVTEKNFSTAKEKRRKQLHDFIWRVREHLLKNKSEKITTQIVWREIKNNYSQYDSDGIIQEVTEDKIFWMSFKSNEGVLKRTSFITLISKLKKNPPF